MATTSTNKQPLLVDRVFHEVVGTDNAYNEGTDANGNIGKIGNNSAALLLNCVGTDGAVVETLYTIARSTTPYTINLYLSTNNDYLRPAEAFFIGSVISATTAGDVTEMTLPKCLTPVPQVGTDPKNSALYVPANKVLWVARDGNSDIAGGPLVGAQGGYF